MNAHLGSVSAHTLHPDLNQLTRFTVKDKEMHYIQKI